MSATWVLVAESSRAKIYSVAGPTMPLVEIEDLVHPSSRLHEGDLVSDTPGSDGGTVGQGRHVYDPQTSASWHEAEAFARELAQRLEEGREKGAFGRMIIIAPPAFLGLMRESLGKEVKHLVAREIPKNLVREPAETLRAYLG